MGASLCFWIDLCGCAASALILRLRSPNPTPPPQVDPNLDVVKGRGGALLREKVCDAGASWWWRCRR